MEDKSPNFVLLAMNTFVDGDRQLRIILTYSLQELETVNEGQVQQNSGHSGENNTICFDITED